MRDAQLGDERPNKIDSDLYNLPQTSAAERLGCHAHSEMAANCWHSSGGCILISFEASVMGASWLSACARPVALRSTEALAFECDRHGSERLMCLG